MLLRGDTKIKQIDANQTNTHEIVCDKTCLQTLIIYFFSFVKKSETHKRHSKTIDTVKQALFI